MISSSLCLDQPLPSGNGMQREGMLAMVSYVPPENDSSSDEKNYTVASTFEKVKSLKFELLFGEWEKKVCKDDNGDVIKAGDYYFAPVQIFGFVCTSYGSAYQRFHHAFVLHVRQVKRGRLSVVSFLMPKF